MYTFYREPFSFIVSIYIIINFNALMPEKFICIGIIFSELYVISQNKAAYIHATSIYASSEHGYGLFSISDCEIKWLI